MRLIQLVLCSVIGAFLLFVSCQSNGGGESTSTPEGQQVYTKYCVNCHGAKGNMGMSGAADLTQSTLNLKERILVIKKGRGTMTSFNNLLSKEEIEAVARYTQKFSEQ